jgi:anthranilate phosphoribosyltransferase
MPEENEIAVRAGLEGRGDEAHSAAIAVNAAALLTLGRITANYRDGFALARSVLESGAAMERLERFAAMSNSCDAAETDRVSA